MIKKILLFLLAILIIIQFFHPAKNKNLGTQPNYIGNVFNIPDDVRVLLSNACNDCHSNNTIYPWYTYIQPVHWWLDDHIKDGKKELNFDEYTNRSLRFQYHKMEEVVEQVKEKEMPIDNYTWIHKQARLSETDRTKLISWANSIMDDMKSKYPLDSLLRKK